MSDPCASLRDRVYHDSADLRLISLLFTLFCPFSFQVKYSAYRDRPVEERKRRFVEDLREGHSVIVSLLFYICKMRVRFPLVSAFLVLPLFVVHIN